MDIPPALPAGLTSFEFQQQAPGFVEAAGFRVVAGRAIRLDMLDRLEEELEQATRSGSNADVLMPKLVSLLGCDRETLNRVLEELGWNRVSVAGTEPPTAVWRMKTQLRREQPQRQQVGKNKHRVKLERSDSPFAQLKVLMNAD